MMFVFPLFSLLVAFLGTSMLSNTSRMKHEGKSGENGKTFMSFVDWQIYDSFYVYLSRGGGGEDFVVSF